MIIRVTIPPGGKQVKVETISILEDLWHDFEFFKREAVRLDHVSQSGTELLLMKRYCRAALVMLIFYLEGVLNHWLRAMVTDDEWVKIEPKCIEKKIDRVTTLLPGSHPGLSITNTKKLRNRLAHLKAGADLQLFDELTPQALTSAEDQIVMWLTSIEKASGIPRHPNTESESGSLRRKLGNPVPDATGHSGDSSD